LVTEKRREKGLWGLLARRGFAARGAPIELGREPSEEEGPFKKNVGGSFA